MWWVHLLACRGFWGHLQWQQCLCLMGLGASWTRMWTAPGLFGVSTANVAAGVSGWHYTPTFSSTDTKANGSHQFAPLKGTGGNGTGTGGAGEEFDILAQALWEHQSQWPRCISCVIVMPKTGLKKHWDGCFELKSCLSDPATASTPWGWGWTGLKHRPWGSKTSPRTAVLPKLSPGGGLTKPSSAWSLQLVQICFSSRFLSHQIFLVSSLWEPELCYLPKSLYLSPLIHLVPLCWNNLSTI